MSVRQECERRLDDATLKIKNGNSELATLTRQRDEAIAAGNVPEALRLKKQLKATQEELEDYTITKLALEAKVRIYDRNDPAAVKVREEVSAKWSELVDVVAGIAAEIQQARKTLTEGLARMRSLEAEVKNLSAKHMELVGETLRIPDLALYGRPYYDALGHLTDKFLDGALAPWTYVSETERSGAAVKQQAKAKTSQEARVQIAIANAPRCPVCDKPMTLRRDAGSDGEEGMLGSGVWSFGHCFKITSVKIPGTVPGSQ
jgi:hypothetical protein